MLPSLIVVTETEWPAKPQIFAFCPFIETLLTPDLSDYFKHYKEFAKILSGLYYGY